MEKKNTFCSVIKYIFALTKQKQKIKENIKQKT